MAPLVTSLPSSCYMTHLHHYTGNKFKPYHYEYITKQLRNFILLKTLMFIVLSILNDLLAS